MILVTEKPLKPIWFFQGYWWSIGVESGEWRVYRFASGGWVAASAVLTTSASTMDVHLHAPYVTWYGWSATTPRVGRLIYNSGDGTWDVDVASSSVPVLASTNMKSAGGHLVVDGVGRAWCFADPEGQIRYFVLDDTLAVIRNDTQLTSDPATAEHVSRSVAWDGKVGVLWDNQTTSRMRFIWRNDADGTATWQAIENASAATASNADDHGDITPGPEGQLLAVWKTSLSGDGSPIIRYARRTAAGDWVDESTVWVRFGAGSTEEHTRPRLVYDTTEDRVFVFATRGHQPGTIQYRVSPRLNPVFGPEQTLINLPCFNATVPHHNVSASSGLRVAAISSGEVVEGFVSILGAQPIVPEVLRVRVNGSVWRNVTQIRRNGVNLTLEAIRLGAAEAFQSVVEFGWIGGATHEGFVVAIKVLQPSNVRIAISTSDQFTNLIFSDLVQDAVGWVRLEMSGLDPDTPYFWAIEENSVLSPVRGVMRTFPAPGQPASFRFAAYSCSSTGSTAVTFERILGREPLFLLHMGDMHYEDIESNNPALYRAAFEAVLSSPQQAFMFQNLPFDYTWDDHDFGPNNSDSTDPGRPAALATYREVVPHRELAFTGDPDDTPISHTFVCGRVRVVMLDTRSEGDYYTNPVGQNVILGSAQLAWLINIIETFTEALLVINVSFPWIVQPSDPDYEPSDIWPNAEAEQAAICDAIQDHARGRVLLVHGDSHMVAMDDGTNTNFATTPIGSGPPLFCFAPADRSNSVKGGPYSEGTFTASNHQYGVVDIDDDGQIITVTGTGYRADTDAALVSYSFEVSGNLITASGALVASPAGVIADAQRVITGSGDLQANTATITGTAQAGPINYASGAIQAGPAGVVAAVAAPITATGALKASTATVAGSADVGVNVSASIQAGPAKVVGLATRTIVASGALKASPAKVVVFSWVEQSSLAPPWVTQNT